MELRSWCYIIGCMLTVTPIMLQVKKCLRESPLSPSDWVTISTCNTRTNRQMGNPSSPPTKEPDRLRMSGNVEQRIENAPKQYLPM